MTTPGYKICTLCGEEIVIDAILCRHCGQIPGLSPAAPPAPRGGTGVRAIAAGLCFVSLAVGSAGFGWSNVVLMGAGGLGFTVGIALFFFGRSRRRQR